MANSFKSQGVAGIGTALTTVYTTPAATTTTTIGLSVANVTASMVLVDVYLSKGAGGAGTGASVDLVLIKSAPVMAGSSLVLVGGDQKVVLEAGNLIKVKSSTAASVDAVMSVLEIS